MNKIFQFFENPVHELRSSFHLKMRNLAHGQCKNSQVKVFVTDSIRS